MVRYAAQVTMGQVSTGLYLSTFSYWGAPQPVVRENLWNLTQDIISPVCNANINFFIS